MINFIINYWSVLIWGVPIAIVFVVLWHFLGWRFSLPVGFLGGALIIFLMGRKIERDNYEKIAKDIRKKRERAYEKIDNRATSRDDVLERLRDGKF